MKNSLKYINIAAVICTALLSLSCDDDESTCGGTPQIAKVSTSLDRTEGIMEGSWDEWIIIQGANFCNVSEVRINGNAVDLKEAYVTATEITVQIPSRVTPSTTNIQVVSSGSTAETAFEIIQPAPVITSFNPVSGGEGDEITITGQFFDNLQSVKFDDVEATIVSKTESQIVVTLPAGVSQAYIYVTTLGGTIKSTNAFGFRYLVYDDALASSWWEGSWSCAAFLDNSTNVKRGTHSIKAQYSGGYGGLKLGNGGATISLTGYTTVKFSIYGGTGTSGNFMVVLNGNYADGSRKQITVTEGVWTDISIPLSELGSPSSLNEIVFQEFSNNASAQIFIDDLGLL